MYQALPYQPPSYGTPRPMPPEGASFQQRQMLEQAQRRLQMSTPGTPVYERNKKYYEDFLRSLQTPAPTRPTIGGQPTSADLQKQIDYERELSRWREQQRRFSGVDYGGPAAIAESARQGAAYQQLLAGQISAARAESNAARVSQELSGQYARQQNQMADYREDYNVINRSLASLSVNQFVPSEEKRQRLIAEARRRAEEEFSSRDSSYEDQIERIKQSYASRGMYGSSAMNDEISKIQENRDKEKNQFAQSYISQAQAQFDRERQMAMQKWRAEKSRLEAERDEYIRMFNQYTRSGASRQPPSYEQIVNDLYWAYSPPTPDWSRFNPAYYGGA